MRRRLKRRQSTGLTVRSPDGLTIREQLTLIRERSQELAPPLPVLKRTDDFPRF